MPLLILFETASGFALFERTEGDEVGDQLPQLQASMQDMSKFSKVVKLKAFHPFASEKQALESINNVSEGVLDDTLKEFLETNIPKVKDAKKSKVQLGVSEEKLGSSIQETLSIPCTKSTTVTELVRGIRLHFSKFLKVLKDGEVEKAQLGLAHAYSRGKVKFNVNRVDNMIIQSISLLDQLDKDINTFAMRVREWYSWHFPELIKVIPDNITYAAVARVVKNKSELTEESLPAIEEVAGSADKAKAILEAARHSMGTDISELDMINIEKFAARVVELAAYRKKLHEYLQHKMSATAPNLSALIGDQVGARLIAHAGSLTNLAKYPASTVQILGAEKALFRALKTKGNTPKYGLIFHSSFIGRASAKNKGRISRYLANKCSIAARIDSFGEATTNKFGEVLKDQVEERLNFYDTGATPRKNVDVMKGVIDGMEDITASAATDAGKRKKDKREKKEKKSKKSRKNHDEDE